MLVAIVSCRVELISDNHWWSERLDAWSAEGYNVDGFHSILANEPSLSSEMLMHFENLINRNKMLNQRIIDSPISQESKAEWLERLDDVSQTNHLIGEWERLVSLTRPWEPFTHRAKDDWKDLGKESSLNRLVERLEKLDPSSIAATQPLLLLFGDPGAETTLSEMIADIELEESRRRKVIEEMAEMLMADGVDVSQAFEMSISEGMEYLAEKQLNADVNHSNTLRIEHEIRPFDDILADKMLEKKDTNLDTQISDIINNLQGRLATLNQTVQEWRDMGIRFSETGHIGPEHLLDWEANLPEIERSVTINLKAMQRWKEFQKLWPDKCPDNGLAGTLEYTEDFLDLVDSLDQEWRDLELRGMELISGWEDHGFAMDMWRERLLEEPRSAIEWFNSESTRYAKALELVDNLLSLDVSINGNEEIESRVAILREYELDDLLLEEMEEWINSNATRSARHRAMLEQSWMEMLRKGVVEDQATSSLSLSEFEELIANSQMQKQKKIEIPVERLQGRIREELETWGRQGFSISAMHEMLEQDPMSLALRISSIREAVASHDRLRRRLSVLDWKRNPELSISVNLDLARPDKLDTLSASIPHLTSELSASEIVDENFTFTPWRPQMRVRQILVPVAQNTVDDAMEAILEDMENETPDKNSQVDEEIAKQELEERKETIVPFKPVTEPLKSIEDAWVVETKNVDTIKPVEETLNEVKEVKEVKTVESKDVLQTSSDIGLDSLIQLLRALGLEQEATDLTESNEEAFDGIKRSIASHVGKEPRDMRLDRLLRLSLRLMPKGDEEDSQRLALIQVLGELAEALSQWTRKRLEARHSGGKGVLLEDALILGNALERIPGPGIALPLESDQYSLPTLDDLEGLAKEVASLKSRVMLPNAGGVR